METEKTWNVPKAENRLSSAMQFASMGSKYDEEVQRILNSICAKSKTGELFKAMVLETRAIVQNTVENRTGYHLNCIHSGKTLYDVILPPQNVDGDEAEAQELGSFDNEEDAKDMASKNEGAIVCSYDPNEWWAVIDSRNKNATGMLYPTKLRAAAFLMHIANPPAWKAYNEYWDGREEHER